MIRAAHVLVFVALAAAGPGASPARGNGPAPRQRPDGQGLLPLLGGNSTDALAGNLRQLLLEFLPTPLYEDQSHWGRQKDVARGVKWSGQGLRVHPEVLRSPKNHGAWWKVRVTADRPADTLVLTLRDAQQAGPGRVTFTALAALDTQVEYERQRWEAGVRLYAGSVRARLRIKLALRCEVTTRLEGKGSLLPDAVFRLRVLQSECGFDNLVVEHVAGVGGEAARLVGDAARGSLKQWRPSLERRLLEKANAAILKAGDTREVRVGLGRLFGNK